MKGKCLFIICCVVWGLSTTYAQELFTTPEECNYTLVRSNKIEGVKCDHYLENVRTFRPKPGDFISFIEEQGREDMMPNCSSFGSWRLTHDNGVVCEYNASSKIVTVLFPNGIKLVKENQIECTISGSVKPGPDYYVYLPRFLDGSMLYLPGEKEPARYMKQNQISGFYKGNRLYNITNDGLLLPTYYLINGVALLSNKEDSIVSFTNQEIKYANGDHIILGRGNFGQVTVSSGSIHRNGGLLTIKEANGKQVCLLTYPNGDKYAGDFRYEVWEGDTYYYLGYEKTITKNIYDALYFPELLPWNGTLIKADGRTIRYYDGKTEQQILAEQQAAQAKTKAEYEQLCKKFGKKYVDAALEQRPIVGMPEALLKAAFKLELKQQGSYSTLYRITGWGWTNFGKTLSNNAYLYSVWVANGRVVDIRSWSSAQ